MRSHCAVTKAAEPGVTFLDDPYIARILYFVPKQWPFVHRALLSVWKTTLMKLAEKATVSFPVSPHQNRENHFFMNLAQCTGSPVKNRAFPKTLANIIVCVSIKIYLNLTHEKQTQSAWTGTICCSTTCVTTFNKTIKVNFGD